MNGLEVTILVISLFIGIKIIDFCIMVLLIKNIENIKSRKKGWIYNYAKMKLGTRF